MALPLVSSSIQIDLGMSSIWHILIDHLIFNINALMLQLVITDMYIITLSGMETAQHGQFLKHRNSSPIILKHYDTL